MSTQGRKEGGREGGRGGMTTDPNLKVVLITTHATTRQREAINNSFFNISKLIM